MKDDILKFKNFNQPLNENKSEIEVGDFVEVTSGKRGIGVVYKIKDESIYVDLGGVKGSFPVVVKQGQFNKMKFSDLPKDKYADIIAVLHSIVVNNSK